MTTKDRSRLAKLNAIVNSINRIIDFGLQYLQQSTTKDLRELQTKVQSEALSLAMKIK